MSMHASGSNSPPVLKSPVLSHFKTDEGHVAKIKSKGYKNAMTNTTFFSPKKSDHSLSFSPTSLSSLICLSLLIHHHHRLSIIGIEIRACQRRRVKQDNGLGN